MSNHPSHASEAPLPPTAELPGWAGNDDSSQLRVLDSVAQFTHHRDIDALDHSLTLSLAELADAHVVTLYKRDGDHAESLVRCTRNAQGRHQLISLPGPADASTHAMLRQGERDGGCVRLRDGSYGMLIPIRRDGHLAAALMLESVHPLEHVRLLVEGYARIYANYIALLDESERDKLTSLHNRRSFERQLTRLLQQSASGQSPQLWLAILDIDHFKRINDTWGHLYGDEVILMIAQQMRASFRQGDALFRFGGEEFVVLLNADGETTAQQALERFRIGVQEHAFPQVGQVTVSVGYAAIGHHDYPATVLDRADKALYFAKNQGRNRVCHYEKLRALGSLDDGVAAGTVDLF